MPTALNSLLNLTNKKLITIAAMLMLANTITAQSNELSGTWRVDGNKTIEIMDSESKSRYDTLSSEVKSRASNAIAGREFVFNNNGEVIINWKSQDGQRTTSGQWSVNDSHTKLSITVDNQTLEYDYELISVNILVMKGKNKGGFFNNLYLQKIN